MKRIDFLQRLIGVGLFGKLPASVLYTKRKVYLLQCFVAGFRHYKGMELLNEMEVNDFIELKREPNNEYDDFAIALYWQQEKIGFIPADYNEIIARLLDASALPLLATITHLNREVKPWENVVIAVYFLQEDKEDLPEYASYLGQLAKPHYKTLPKKKIAKERDLMDDLFNHSNRIIDINTIHEKAAKEYYTKYFAHKKILFNKKEYLLVDNDGFYTYMYNSFPLKWIVADDGNKYLLFEYREEE